VPHRTVLNCRSTRTAFSTSQPAILPRPAPGRYDPQHLSMRSRIIVIVVCLAVFASAVILWPLVRPARASLALLQSTNSGGALVFALTNHFGVAVDYDCLAEIKMRDGWYLTNASPTLMWQRPPFSPDADRIAPGSGIIFGIRPLFREERWRLRVGVIPPQSAFDKRRSLWAMRLAQYPKLAAWIRPNRYAVTLYGPEMRRGTDAHRVK